MKKLYTFQVFPNLPEPLAFLEQLARNLWWSWKSSAVELFRRIDPRLWEECGRNPLVFLTRLPQARMEDLANDESFLAHMQGVKERFEKGIAVPLPQETTPLKENETIAYFSMEFGLHESIPIFAGGLGILAGDHLKASSDLSLPITGVGLLYRHGYFRQVLDAQGQQQEEYAAADLYNLPVQRAKDSAGREITVSAPGPDGDILATVWKIQIGRIALFLLDTNLHDNPPAYRNITSNLYVSEPKDRLCQELVLGIGGIRALTALNLYPKVCHMNEGHPAFSSLERLSLAMSTHSVDLKTAMEIVPRTTIFTTHTPVAAGHDEFSADLVRPVLKPFEQRIGVSASEILSWGQTKGAASNSKLSMFYLGRRMSQYCNGVSRLHGHVARQMWAHEWPGKPVDEVPISHITNGVHLASWLSPEIALLFERYLGPLWHRLPHDPKQTQRVEDIYDDELWHAHETARSRLVRTCRQQLVKQYRRRNAAKAILEEVRSVLDPDVLTIGFARRFATYKRAYLLLQDEERFEAILNSKHHPVQIIFAGKAHPSDNEGKDIVKRLFQFAQRSSARGKVIFLEDYDMHLGRCLCQGADIWLNTPRRPFEACGTSGMKAAINGVLNVSILDGWWAEGYREAVGWCIGNGDEGSSDPSFQDDLEAQALYNVLENDVLPAFYDRKNGNAPKHWLQMMRASMQMAMKNFSGLRMVHEYENRFYFPAARWHDEMVVNQAELARELAAQRKRLLEHWQQIRIDAPRAESEGPFRVGDTFRISTDVHLGALRPDEVSIQIYYGKLSATEIVQDSRTKEMTVEKQLGDGNYLYSSQLSCHTSGRYGFSARAIPTGDEWQKNIPGLITWASTA